MNQILFNEMAGDTRLLIFYKRMSNGRKKNGATKYGRKYLAVKSRPGRRNLQMRLNAAEVDELLSMKPSTAKSVLFDMFQDAYESGRAMPGGIGR